MPASFTPAQNAFHIYNDDGSQSAATSAAVQGANLSITDGGGNKSYHLRIGIQETGGASGSAGTWRLQYSKNGGAYTNVTTASSNVKAFDSTNLTDGGATTSRLTGMTGTFVAGQVAETGLTGSMTLTASNNTEHLFAIQTVDSDLGGGDTLDFRVILSGSVLNAYNSVPRITNAAAAGSSAARSYGYIY